MSCAYVSRDTPRGGAWQKGSTRDSLSTEDGAVKFPTGQGDITDWTGLVFLGCMPGRGGQVAGGRGVGSTVKAAWGVERSVSIRV